MHKTAQAWFTGGLSSSAGASSSGSQSVLAEWNSYAAARSAEEEADYGLDFDIESSVRTANDKVSGTFSV
jgi:hypothetical protein